MLVASDIDGTRSRSRARRFAAAVAAVTVVASVLAARGLGRDSLRYDEGVSWYVSRLPTGRFVSALWSDEANLTLYYLLERAVTAFGDSELALRLPSLVAAVAAVAVIAVVGRRLGGELVGVVAAAALALNGLEVEFARVARGYTLGALLSTVLLYALLRTDSVAPGRWWALYAAAGTLAVYDHLLAVVVLASLGLVVLVLHPQGRAARRPWLLATAATAVACAPLLHPLVIRRAQGPVGPPLTAKRLGEVASGVAGGGGPALLAIAGLLAALAVARGVQRVRSGGDRRELWPVALTAVPLVVFTTVVVVISRQQSFLELRYWLLVLPMLALLEAQGVVALRPWRVLVTGAAVLLLVASGLGVRRYFQRDEREPWRTVVAAVEHDASRGDAVLVYTPERAILYGYYADGGAAPVVYPPAGYEQLPLWEERRWPPIGPALEAASGAPVLWVVRNAPPVGETDPWDAARAPLGAAYERRATQATGLLLVERWVRR